MDSASHRAHDRAIGRDIAPTEVPGKEIDMETLKTYRSDVEIPVLDTTSAFARGVTLTEAFRLWQAHDHGYRGAKRVSAGMNTLASSKASTRVAHQAVAEMRACA